MNIDEFNDLKQQAKDGLHRAIISQGVASRGYGLDDALTALLKLCNAHPSEDAPQQSKPAVEPTLEQESGIRNKITMDWLRARSTDQEQINFFAVDIMNHSGSASSEYLVANFAIHALNAIRALEQELDHYQHLAGKEVDAANDQKRGDCDAFNQMIRAAYLAGFNASGEAWNGEYPFKDFAKNPEVDQTWVDYREESLKDLLISNYKIT